MGVAPPEATEGASSASISQQWYLWLISSDARGAFGWITANVDSMTGMDVCTANHSAAARLETKLRRLLATTADLGNPGCEAEQTHSDLIDLAQAAAGRDASEALRSLLGELRQDVERALARLGTGTYGICEECSEPIPLERLRALPEATRCVRCQRRHPRIGACA